MAKWVRVLAVQARGPEFGHSYMDLEPKLLEIRRISGVLAARLAPGIRQSRVIEQDIPLPPRALQHL